MDRARAELIAARVNVANNEVVHSCPRLLQWSTFDDAARRCNLAAGERNRNFRSSTHG